MPELNKDFYKDLPGMVCEQLDNMFIPTLQKINPTKFSVAWEEYREHVLSSSMDEMMMPYGTFKKYFTSEEMS